MSATCPRCGQTLPPSGIAGLPPLPGMQQRVLDLLVKAGPHGISTDALVERVYAQDPDGGPQHATTCVRIAISRLRKLLRPLGKDITVSAFGGRSFGSGNCGIYRLVDRTR